MEPTDGVARLLAEHTRIAPAPLTPELRFRLANPASPLWAKDEDALAAQGLPAPFWAFAWGGGQALARLILEEPERVKNRSVLDFGCGCAIAGIAAARAGAAQVTASEIDPFAVAAARANAALNGVDLDVRHDDLVGSDDGWDVVLAGDVFYETEAGGLIAAWLGALHVRGAAVLIGDPGRAFLPRHRLTPVARFHAPEAGALDDLDVGAARVWRFID